MTKKQSTDTVHLSALSLGALTGVGIIALILLISTSFFFSAKPVSFSRDATSSPTSVVDTRPPKPVLDTVAYDKKMLSVAQIATSSKYYEMYLNDDFGTSTPPLWPVRAPYPKPGAILPFKRIVAYYGNFYSKGMGVLGEYPEAVMLDKLRAEVAAWEAADPETPVVPAIHYIVETAQIAPGKQGLYLARMPDSQIDIALRLAEKVNGIVFIDFQVSLSTLEKELPMYEDYLKLPNVHLGIDPEFSMKTGVRPGKVIGSFDAADINYAINYLSRLVQENDLPPKVLVVHRFTYDMVTNTKRIKPTPEVQFVMDMDGWGGPEKKIGTYTHIIVPEPVQFTGFKLFYKNDLFAPSSGMLTPKQLLKLTPQPLYIQYQ
ncbi:MAG: hypothetical protein KBD06_02830 [Candidatus Pacebacteria bacterium]|nr:hypothetical protein [Candidatus Paceibacterota bacterium]